MVRSLFGALIVLAVLGAGCATTTKVSGLEDSDTRLVDESQASIQPSAPAVVPPLADAPSATAEQTGDNEAPETNQPAEQTSVGVPYSGAPVSDFRAPSSWQEQLPPDTRIGDSELENGTRVVIQPNRRPGSQAQFRLVVAAGSVHENPESLGSAHFLEHMMFNGTDLFPGNELVPVLEGFGAGFGADINAYTSFEETVYTLTVPTSDFDDIELALDVLAQWAYHATIDPDAVVAERGVIREEYRRSAETSSGRLSAVLRDAIFEGTSYAGRDPIGTLQSIESMTARELRAFYERWYRPENLTVVAVGDFEPAAVRRAILARFDDVPDARGPERAVDDVVTPFTEPLFDVVTDPELSLTEVQVSWRVDGGPVETRNDLRRALVNEMVTTVLDTRIFEAVQRQETQLVSAGTGTARLTSTLDLATLQGRAEPASVLAALTDLLHLAEQLRQHPISGAEFARARERIVTRIEQRFAESGSVQDSRQADRLVEFALRGAVVMDPDVARNTSIEVLDTVAPVDLQARMHVVLEAEPYVLVSGPSAAAHVFPGPEELAETYSRTVGTVVAEPQITIAQQTQLLERPAAAQIVDEVYLQALDATVFTYANGARLAAKRTSVVESRIEFQAWSRGGFFQEESSVVPLLGRSSALVMPSGFESLDTIALDQILGTRTAHLSGTVGRAIDMLNGESSTEDLETLFQLIYLQMTESTIDDLQVRRFDEAWRPLAEDPAASPQLAADLRLWSMRYGDSPYFRLFPTLADLDTIDSEAQLAAFRRRFDNAADFIFVAVGDLDPSIVGDLGAHYLGTLPASADREVAVDRDPGVPEQNLVETIAVGVGDQGRLRINWESPYEASIAAEVRAHALEIVVDARLRDLIREELGASYSPQASVSVLREPKPWVDTIIEIDGDPRRLDEISTTIRDELARIRVGTLDPDYLRLAVSQLTESYRFYSNPDWIAFLTTHLAYEDRPADEHRQRADIARALTMADISATAQVVFPASRSVEVRMVPAE